MAGYDTVVQVVSEGIQAMDNIVRVGDKSTPTIPWMAFSNMCKTLDRCRKEFSTESFQLIEEIFNLIKIAQDDYVSVTQNIGEWVSDTKERFIEFRNLFINHTPGTYSEQMRLFIQSLDTGLSKMGVAQNKLLRTATSFRSMPSTLIDIRNQLDVELDPNSEYHKNKVECMKQQAISQLADIGVAVDVGNVNVMLDEAMENAWRNFHELKSLVDESNSNIDLIEEKLRNDIENIKNVKAKSDETVYDFVLTTSGGLDMFRDAVTNSVNELVRQCETYLIGGIVN